MGKFSGVWASFENLDETTEAIEKIREQGKQPQVISPCPRHEIEHALGEPQTRLPFISLLFGGLGCLTGYSFPAWTASDWVLPVSGKPVVSIPPFTISRQLSEFIDQIKQNKAGLVGETSRYRLTSAIENPSIVS